MRRGYVDGPFGQIHYRRVDPPTAGLAPPLICFHLSPLSGRVYARWIEEIGTDRVAVAPDTPGFGSSDPPPGPPSIGDYAAAMAALIDTLGFQQVDLMGYHTGSKIAVELALTRPETVRKLVLISAPVYTDEELARQRETMGRPEPPTEQGEHLLRMWDGHWNWRGPGQSADHVTAALADVLRAGEQAWWGHHAAFAYQHGERLPQVIQPVLVLCPDDDLTVPTRRAESLIRNGRVQEMPGFGHGMLDLHPGEVAPIVREFLDGSSE